MTTSSSVSTRVAPEIMAARNNLDTMPYAIDVEVSNKGRRFARTKRRIKFSFGFGNKTAMMEEGKSAAECRGEEHEVVMIWSLTSGKQRVLADGLEVHFSRQSSSVMAPRTERRFECKWTMKSGHQVTVSTAWVPLGLTNTKSETDKRQFDLQIDGMSFWDMPKIFQLGKKKSKPIATTTTTLATVPTVASATDTASSSTTTEAASSSSSPIGPVSSEQVQTKPKRRTSMHALEQPSTTTGTTTATTTFAQPAHVAAAFANTRSKRPTHVTRATSSPYPDTASEALPPNTLAGWEGLLASPEPVKHSHSQPQPQPQYFMMADNTTYAGLSKTTHSTTTTTSHRRTSFSKLENSWHHTSSSNQSSPSSSFHERSIPFDPYFVGDESINSSITKEEKKEGCLFEGTHTSNMNMNMTPMERALKSLVDLESPAGRISRTPSVSDLSIQSELNYPRRDSGISILSPSNSMHSFHPNDSWNSFSAGAQYFQTPQQHPHQQQLQQQVPLQYQSQHNSASSLCSYHQPQQQQHVVFPQPPPPPPPIMTQTHQQQSHSMHSRSTIYSFAG